MIYTKLRGKWHALMSAEDGSLLILRSATGNDPNQVVKNLSWITKSEFLYRWFIHAIINLYRQMNSLLVKPLQSTREIEFGVFLPLETCVDPRHPHGSQRRCTITAKNEREKQSDLSVCSVEVVIFCHSSSVKIMSTIESREWNKLFPVDVSSEADSALFIHRLFTVTLSALTARRRIFSNDHFSSKKLGPLSVPLFTRPASAKEQRRFNSTVFSWVGVERCWKWCVFICSFFLP